MAGVCVRAGRKGNISVSVNSKRPAYLTQLSGKSYCYSLQHHHCGNYPIADNTHHKTETMNNMHVCMYIHVLCIRIFLEVGGG